MNKPVKYCGKFIVTTQSNRQIAICCSKEQAEFYLETRKNRKLWQWMNDSMRDRYGYQCIK